MKIADYNQMYKYLIRKPNAVPPKTKTIQKFKEGGSPKKMLVAEKPQTKPTPDKPNGHSDWTSDDWLEVIDPGGWMREETIKPPKQSGILEQDLANEYWQEQYEKYLKDGGTLDFKNFLKMQFEKKISRNVEKDIDNRVKDKMSGEGIANLLALGSSKI